MGAAVGFQEVFHPLPVGFLPGRLNAQNEAREGKFARTGAQRMRGKRGGWVRAVRDHCGGRPVGWVGVLGRSHQTLQVQGRYPYLPAVGIAFLLEFQHATSTHNRWHASAGMKMMGWSVSFYHIYQFWEGNLLHSLTHQ